MTGRWHLSTAGTPPLHLARVESARVGGALWLTPILTADVSAALSLPLETAVLLAAVLRRDSEGALGLTPMRSPRA